MITFNRIQLSLLLVLLIVIASCKSSKDNSLFEDGILIEIYDLIEPELLDIIENVLETPIHRGDNPPNVEGVYLMSPYLLHRTNVPVDAGRVNPGQRYADLHIRLSKQDRRAYRVQFDTVHHSIGESPSHGPDSFVIGNENQFTVFGFLERRAGESTIKTLYVFSGILEQDGISSPHTALLMLDNDGASQVIPNNTGRSFVHGNNKALTSNWPIQPQKVSTDDENISTHYGSSTRAYFPD